MHNFQNFPPLFSVIQSGKPIFDRIKGKWRSEHFDNEHELVLELGCGRGEYTVGLAREFPDRNFIGVDIKGSRIWVGSAMADKEGLHNVAFLRTQIQSLENFFEPREVDEVWITFPDPRPKLSDERRRLTCPRFLEIYKRIIKPGGIIHLKTDNEGLFEYTLEVMKERNDLELLGYTRDLKQSAYAMEHYNIQTKYERLFEEQGYTIKYLRASFTIA